MSSFEHRGAKGSGDSDTVESVKTGPPPDLKRRSLIFDSLNKTVQPGDKKSKGSSRPDGTVGYRNKGTYVFTWGAGYHGELGRVPKPHSQEKRYAPVPTLVGAPLNNVVVRQIACGGLHTAVCTEDGRVFTWGEGRYGQLGHSKESSTQVDTPTQVPLPSGKVIQVACGGMHTLALDEGGKVYSWGSNRTGQLGWGQKKDRVSEPAQVKMGSDKARRGRGSGPPVKFIAAGENHSFAIAEDGRVYSWGLNEHGQIGHGRKKSRRRGKIDEKKKDDEELEEDSVESDRRIIPEPVLVRGSKEAPFADVAVVEVACGAIHSVLLSDKGDVYVCGFGEFMGTGEANSHFFYYPTKVIFKDAGKITQVACGLTHILALSETGDVYSWGAGKYGQLGHGVNGNLNCPRVVLRNKNIASIAAGRYHSLAVTAHGVLFSWGCGENGQLGHGDDNNLTLPKVVESSLGTVVGQIACGEHHTAAITSAPWTKISPDVLDWMNEQRAQYAETVKLLGGNRGLTLKDHERIAEQMKIWRKEEQKRREEDRQKEKAEEAHDIKAIQGKGRLLDDIVSGDILAAAEQVPDDASATGDDKGSAPVSPRVGHRGKTVPALDMSAVHDKRSATDRARKGDGQSAQEKERLAHTAPGLPLIATVSNADGKDESHGIVGTVTHGTDRRNGFLPDVTRKQKHQPRPPQTARLQAEREKPARVRSGSRTARTARSGSGGGGADDRYAEKDSDAPSSNTARTMFLKETAAALKQMAHIVSGKGDSGSRATLRRMQDVVLKLRTQYDTLHNKSLSLEQKVADLDRERALVDASMKGMNNNNKDSELRLQGLEMQFETVNIKLQEAAQNRKNYELNITHLKEEEYEHQTDIKKRKKKVDELAWDLKQHMERQIEAFEERDKAEAELAQFQDEIVTYRKFVETQLANFEQVLDTVQQQSSNREKTSEKNHAKEQARLSKRMASLEKQALDQEKEVEELSKELNGWDVKLQHLQKRYREITDATGLDDPQAIINKFKFKNEIQVQLESELSEKAKQVEEFQWKERELRESVGTARSQFKDARWRDVDHMADNSREIQSRAARAHSTYDKEAQRLTHVQEGLLNLLRSLEGVPGNEDDKLDLENGRVWKVEEASKLFERVDQLVLPVIDEIKRREDEEKRLQEQLQREREEEEEEERRRMALEKAMNLLGSGSKAASQPTDAPTDDAVEASV